MAWRLLAKSDAPAGSYGDIIHDRAIWFQVR
jgi:hypothetical protein